MSCIFSSCGKVSDYSLPGRLEIRDEILAERIGNDTVTNKINPKHYSYLILHAGASWGLAQVWPRPASVDNRSDSVKSEIASYGWC